MSSSDIIAAISTPPGESGIGIVRITGPGSIELVNPLLKTTSFQNLTKLPNSKLCHGFVVNNKNITIDEVLVCAMRAPKTYTAEDTVEINCHGGPIAIRRILELVIKRGARLAEPGEFTKRAFLNGRIDLTQAEAVAEIISAKSKKALSTAVNQIKGKLSYEIEEIREDLVKVLANIEVAVDFSDDEPDISPNKFIAARLSTINKRLKRLITSYNQGRYLKEGILTVIAGPPNAGKSSILNALLKHERAIVTEIPGTTRDLIEETVNIKGVPVVIRDTAGIRKPKDKAEKAGVELTHESVKQADLILLVFDGSQKNKKLLLKMAKAVNGRRIIAVLNKKDLGLKISAKDVNDVLKCSCCVETSARLDEGIEKLEKAINKVVFSKKISGNEIIVTNLRHVELLKTASNNIIEGQDKLKNETEEIAALFIREALEALDSITGKKFQADLLNEIFNGFCVGK
jgi:tRNA modification GTPase